MASYQAIRAVSQALIDLLASRFEQAGLGNEGYTFAIYQSDNFNQPMVAGLSLFLYRILPNGSRRTPTGRLGPDGRRLRTRLPLDLYFLMTSWAQDASLQHEIMGLAMRVLEDTPILPAGLVNATAAAVFLPDETVEIGIAELTNEDILRIWETVTENRYQLSVPYVARNIQIDSDLPLDQGEVVQERLFAYGKGPQNRTVEAP